MSTEINLFIAGDPDVGKTSLLQQYLEQTFSEDSKKTNPFHFPDVKTKNIYYNDVEYILKIWDTAEQQRYFRRYNPYRNANGILLVYDVTNRDSYENLKQWFQEAGRYAPEASIVLVGNKIDLNEKVVDFSIAKDFAESFPIPIIETSAKNGRNVAKAFYTLVDAKVKRDFFRQMRVPEIESAHCCTIL